MGDKHLRQSCADAVGGGERFQIEKITNAFTQVRASNVSLC